MTTSNLNIRLDDNLRAQATAVFSGYGLSPTQAIKLFFTQVAQTGVIPLQFDYARKQPEYEKNSLTMQAINDVRNGTLSQYNDFNEFLDELEN